MRIAGTLGVMDISDGEGAQPPMGMFFEPFEGTRAYNGKLGMDSWGGDDGMAEDFARTFDLVRDDSTTEEIENFLSGMMAADKFEYHPARGVFRASIGAETRIIPIMEMDRRHAIWINPGASPGPIFANMNVYLHITDLKTKEVTTRNIVTNRKMGKKFEENWICIDLTSTQIVNHIYLKTNCSLEVEFVITTTEWREGGI